jgi:geranylgeranyl diphosphate synthase, type II
VNIAYYQERIDFEIRKIIGQFPATPENLYAPLQYTLEHGGKRIRPVLTLAGCGVFSEKIDLAIPAALGIELFHNFTLLHDDIMDNAPLRRGRETVFRKWNPNIAILSGDALFAESVRLVAKSPIPVLAKIIDRFCYTAIQVCEGQQLDMDFENQSVVHVDEYLNMIRLKTAVLPAAALEIGALCGGADPEEAELLNEFGLHIGMAFQLQDDVLDTYGDAGKVGKQRGGDILANKKTVLMLLALERATGKDLEELNNWISAKHFEAEEKVNAVIEIFNRCHVLDEAKRFMNDHQQKAFDAIEHLHISPEKKTALHIFADQLLNREH